MINQALSAPRSRLLGLVATLGLGMLLLMVLLRQPLRVTTEIGGLQTLQAAGFYDFFRIAFPQRRHYAGRDYSVVERLPSAATPPWRI